MSALFKAKKILIAEDDAASCKILETLLKRWGYEVLEAPDGQKAWDIFRNDPDIQLVVSDWMMPDVDGLELCKRIRAVQDRKYTFFILLTAKTQIDDVILGLESGADDFVTKPFNQYELKVRIMAGERIIDLERQLATKVDELSEAYQQIKTDLTAAAAMQKSMLPPTSGNLLGLKFSSSYIPSSAIGGDFYNLFELQENKLGIYIFDVSGHGVPAALQSVGMGMMMTPYDPQSSILLDPSEGDGPPIVVPPATVTERLNSRFQSSSSKGDFVTCLYGVFDLDDGSFTYTRAGHPQPVIISNGKLNQAHDKGDIPIGILPDYVYGDNTIKLSPGERLYLFTDGISEAANADGKRFGDKLLNDHLVWHADSTLQKSISTLMDKVLQWHGGKVSEDDMSILGIEFGTGDSI